MANVYLVIVLDKTSIVHFSIAHALLVPALVAKGAYHSPPMMAEGVMMGNIVPITIIANLGSVLVHKWPALILANV